MTTDEQALEDVLFRLSWIDRAILDGGYYRDKPRPYSDGYRDGINDCIRLVRDYLTGYQGGLIISEQDAIGQLHERVKAIERLRELTVKLGDEADRDEYWVEYEEIEHIFYKFGYKEDARFEEGGRWSNYRETIYSISAGDAKAYFRFTEEVPASEMQEDMYLSFWLNEVEPVEVKAIEWKTKI
jgi:hypothetical protein